MEIVLNHVTKRIKKQNVINDISIKISEGRISGFAGINGSGKTMLMRLIAGLIYATSGYVSIDNRVLGKELTFPENMGILLENPAFLNSYTGYENLSLLCSIQNKVKKEDIIIALNKVGLSDSKNMKYKKYSLGMKQRLGIAAAIMEQPDLIVLDEPTNSLDTQGINMVKEVVRDQKRRGATVIISCHEKTILEELSDEIYYIESGKITAHQVMV